MDCDVCGASATVHVTELDADTGEKTGRHLCEVHAQEAGYAVPSGAEAVMQLVPQIRKLTAFIKANKRMPSPAELEQLGGFGHISSAKPGTKEFNNQLAYFEALADFIEAHGRPPTENELPDPF